MAEPWKTEMFFSSPWNYLPEVIESFNFPEEVTIHDVTLRDGEQQAGVEFTADEKVRIAEALAEAGVHRIEAGLPAVSPADREAIERMVAADLPGVGDRRHVFDERAQTVLGLLEVPLRLLLLCDVLCDL